MSDKLIANTQSGAIVYGAIIVVKSLQEIEDYIGKAIPDKWLLSGSDLAKILNPSEEDTLEQVDSFMDQIIADPDILSTPAGFFSALTAGHPLGDNASLEADLEKVVEKQSLSTEQISKAFCISLNVELFASFEKMSVTDDLIDFDEFFQETRDGLAIIRWLKKASTEDNPNLLCAAIKCEVAGERDLLDYL